MSTCGDLIDSGNKDGAFLNQIINRGQNIVFSARSTTAVTISDLEIATFAKKKEEETMTEQVKRQANA
jgi:hypothetical protein